MFPFASELSLKSAAIFDSPPTVTTLPVVMVPSFIQVSSENPHPVGSVSSSSQSIIPSPSQHSTDSKLFVSKSNDSQPLLTISEPSPTISKPPPLNSELSVPTQSNVHPVISQSKARVLKPRVFTGTLSSIKPVDIHEDMAIPEWKEAVYVELQALVRNHTWDLVPALVDRCLVGCKWLFKVKKEPRC